MKKFISNPVNLILTGILLAILFSLLFAEKGLVKRVKIEIEIKKLKKAIEMLEKENAELRHKIYKLETNPMEIERIAREKYGMAREGEEVFDIKEK